MRFSRDSFRIFRFDAGQPASWSDGAWQTETLDLSLTLEQFRLEDAFIRFTSVGANSNISSTLTPLSNALYAKSMLKAWGHVDINAGVIQSMGTNQADGFNSQTPTITDAGLSLTVAMRLTLDDANYAPVASFEEARLIANVTRVSAQTFKIFAHDELAGTPFNFSDAGSTLQVFWHLFGTDS